MNYYLLLNAIWSILSKLWIPAPVRWLSWLECCPTHQKLAGLILDQDVQDATYKYFSLTSMFLCLCLCPCPCLSQSPFLSDQKSINIPPGKDEKSEFHTCEDLLPNAGKERDPGSADFLLTRLTRVRVLLTFSVSFERDSSKVFCLYALPGR